MTIGAALPLADVLEKDLQAQVMELAHLTGWKRGYHTYDSRRSPSGFPDLVLVRERIVFLELKREKGKCSPAQREWLRALDEAGGEVWVIRPRNLDTLAKVLSTNTTQQDRRQPLGARRWLDAVGELRAELDRELA